MDHAFKCPECGSENCNAMFQITVLTPANFMHNFTKKRYMSSKTEVWGCDWDNAYIICKECSWQKHPLHNQENILRARISELEQKAIIGSKN